MNGCLVDEIVGGLKVKVLIFEDGAWAKWRGVAGEATGKTKKRSLGTGKTHCVRI